MADDTKNTKEVPMNNAAVKQKHRMAAGFKTDGQSLPPEPKKEGSKANA